MGGGVSEGTGAVMASGSDVLSEAGAGVMSLKPPSTAAVMMPRKRATMLRMVADHNRW